MSPLFASGLQLAPTILRRIDNMTGAGSRLCVDVHS